MLGSRSVPHASRTERKNARNMRDVGTIGLAIHTDGVFGKLVVTELTVIVRLRVGLC